MDAYNVTSSSLLKPSHLALAAVLAMAVFLPSVQARPIMADARRELGTDASPYANFLVGRFAMTQGDIATASRAMGAASQADPQNIALREKAFLVGILNGDIDQATMMSAQLGVGTDTSRLMTPILSTVTAVKANKAPIALKSLDVAAKANPKARMVVMLRPYVLAMNGQWKSAVDDSGDAALAANDSDRLLVYLVKSERARVQELHGNVKDAEVLYTSLYQPGAAAFIFGPDYASFLERQGRKDEARAIWQEIVNQSNDATAVQALKRLDAADYTKPALPDLRQSMAQALFLSATISFSERDSEMALATLRLSMYLDDTPDRARVFLGQVQQDLRDPIAAEAAWASVPATSPYASEASLRRIWSLRGRKDNDTALALANDVLARDPDNLGVIVEKANILHDRGDDAGALTLFNDRITRAGSADFTWQAWFLQAMVYDNLDQWDKAEAAITKARDLNGSRPEILNFLGYGWINRGLHVQDGMDLVRQAMAVNPKSGAIVDSLGWGYYKLGQYDDALTYIEQAVMLSPSDAEINEHLGDVYKAVGRNAEATYEWQRVLTLEVGDKEQVRVRQKLEDNAASLKIATVPGVVTGTTALNDQAAKPTGKPAKKSKTSQSQN